MLAVFLINCSRINPSMLIAIPVSGNQISGPGEAKEILIMDSENNYSIIERYENPALTATSAPGLRMIQSLIERKVLALIVAHIGAHAFELAHKKLSIYNSDGQSIDAAVSAYRSGRLQEATAELPGHHHDHGHAN